MKINKLKKAAILATVLGGVAFGSNAEAAKIAAVAVGSYGAETQIGTVEGSFVTSEIKGINPGEVTDLSGDVAIYNIFADNESSLYIRQTENMGTAVYDGITLELNKLFIYKDLIVITGFTPIISVPFDVPTFPSSSIYHSLFSFVEFIR